MQVPRLVSRIGPEPPAEYVVFVARHLEPLRDEASRVVGADGSPDALYTDVLTDVASRWGFLELARRHLRRPEAATAYLRHAFDHRVQRWHAARTELREAAPVEVQVWSADRPAPAWFGTAPVEMSAPAGPAGGTGTAASSTALRLARVLVPAPRRSLRPVVEAGVAWWHAYDSQRRLRRIALLVVFCALALLGPILGNRV